MTCLRLPRLALMLALALAAAPLAHGQDARAFEVLRDWDAGDGAKTDAILDTLRLTSGSIHSPKVYADFVFRFEYRIAAVDDQAELLLRTGGQERNRFSAYAVTLTTGIERGRLSASRQVLHDTGFTRRDAPAVPGTWIPCEVRAEGERLTVSVDGAVVSTADRAEQAFGTIGFHVLKGAVELRGMSLAPIQVPNVMPADLPRADGPGITPPKALHLEPPHYTAAAMRARAQGVALLEFVVQADGRVGAIQVKSAPHPDLAVAAVACVRQSRFAPAQKDGVAVAVVATIDVAFKLKN